MKFYLLAPLFLLILATSPGCKQKNGKAKSVKAEMVGKTEATDLKENKGISFKTLSAAYPALNAAYGTCNVKYKVVYEDSGQRIPFNVNAKMERGKVVYLNASVIFGVVVAEAVVRPDSFFVENKLQKIYYTGSIDALYGYSPFPFTFSLLEQLLTGVLALDSAAIGRIDTTGPDQYGLVSKEGGGTVWVRGSKPGPKRIEMGAEGQMIVMEQEGWNKPETFPHALPYSKTMILANEKGREAAKLQLSASSIVFGEAYTSPRRLAFRPGFSKQVLAAPR